jgi:alpha-glucosidase
VRSGYTVRGRDGCRVPLPWVAADGRGPSYGFNSGELSWLPQPESFARYALDVERGVEGSTYELYRTAIRTRREQALGAGDLRWVEAAGPEVLAFVNGDTLVIANLGAPAARLPEGAEVLVSSGPLSPDGTVPTDTTVWLRVAS